MSGAVHEDTTPTNLIHLSADCISNALHRRNPIRTKSAPRVQGPQDVQGQQESDGPSNLLTKQVTDSTPPPLPLDFAGVPPRPRPRLHPLGTPSQELDRALPFDLPLLLWLLPLQLPLPVALSLSFARVTGKLQGA